MKAKYMESSAATSGLRAMRPLLNMASTTEQVTRYALTSRRRAPRQGTPFTSTITLPATTVPTNTCGASVTRSGDRK